VIAYRPRARGVHEVIRVKPSPPCIGVCGESPVVSSTHGCESRSASLMRSRRRVCSRCPSCTPLLLCGQTHLLQLRNDPQDEVLAFLVELVHRFQSTGAGGGFHGGGLRLHTWDCRGSVSRCQVHGARINIGVYRLSTSYPQYTLPP